MKSITLDVFYLNEEERRVAELLDKECAWETWDVREHTFYKVDSVSSYIAKGEDGKQKVFGIVIMGGDYFVINMGPKELRLRVEAAFVD